MSLNEVPESGQPPMVPQGADPIDRPENAENVSGRRFLAPGSAAYRVAGLLAYGLIALAIFSGFWFVATYGVNVYWGDDWDTFPPLFERYDAGTLTIAHFWERNNEHRVLFPKLTIFGLGLLTQGNTLVNLYVIEALLAATLGIFYVAFRRHFSGGLAVWLMVPVAFLVFSFRQWDNMLWDFQLTFVMTSTAMLAALLCLSRITDQRVTAMFAGGVVAATIASYSSVQGLFVWPVGLAQLLVIPLARRTRMLLAVLWGALGVVEWTVYFIGYVKPAHHPPLSLSWTYLTTIFGGPLALTDSPRRAIAAGIVVFVLAAAALILVLVKRKWSEYSFWLATMAASAATLGSITLGRSGFGSEQALSSRYVTLSIPLLVAIFMLFALLRKDAKNPVCSFLFWITLGLVLFGVGSANVTELKFGQLAQEMHRYGRVAVCSLDLQPDAMIACIYGNDNRNALLRKSVATLERLKLNVFADPALPERLRLPPPGLPTIHAETPFDFNKISRLVPGVVHIRGWAVDWPKGTATGHLAGGVAVVFDGVAYPACYGLPSEEAVKALDDEKFRNAGFGCTLPVEKLNPGNHTMSLRILNRDRTAVYATTDSGFTLRQRIN